jgi:general secretion pathway protein F
MPAYQFEALDAQGTSRKGVIEADTVKSARAMLSMP